MIMLTGKDEVKVLTGEHRELFGRMVLAVRLEACAAGVPR